MKTLENYLQMRLQSMPECINREIYDILYRLIKHDRTPEESENGTWIYETFITKTQLERIFDYIHEDLSVKYAEKFGIEDWK